MKDSNEASEERNVDRMIARKTVLSFAILVFGFALAIAGWKWLVHQPLDNEEPKPLRTVLNVNEKINSFYYSNQNLAREYPKSAAAKKVRVNGDIGMGEDFDLRQWSLNVSNIQADKASTAILLKMEDIKALPKQEEIFNFKCIEGWSQVSHWGGVRFSDFLMKYHLGTHSGKAPDPKHPEDLFKYVGLMTPDSLYYVGIDMKSMLHPQTLLCYEVNQGPLPMNQGYPLRLIITVKYGIKSLKRIGYIYFSDKRPADYWYERGYDYDSGL